MSTEWKNNTKILTIFEMEFKQKQNRVSPWTEVTVHLSLMCLPGSIFNQCYISRNVQQYRLKSIYCHRHKVEEFQTWLRYCVWPTGHLNSGSVGEAGQRSSAQVSLHWGHLPFEGISSAMCGSLSWGGDGRLLFFSSCIFLCSNVFFPICKDIFLSYIFNIFFI